MNLGKILDVYFTDPERLIFFLQKIDKQVLIDCLSKILHDYANDVNSSSLREVFTLVKAGYEAIPGKLGYNGKTIDGVPCDVKPINIRSDAGGKLNGGGNFSDFTYERLNRYFNDGVMMLVSGFVDGHLVYIFEFPFSCLESEIRRQLDRFFTVARRPGQYLRSASFSFKHYRNSPDLKVIYKTPSLEDFKQYVTTDLFLFLWGTK